MALRIAASSPSDTLPALYRMAPAEAARFIRQCDSALRSHASDFDMGWDKENALSAFESVVATLLEIREYCPAEHANIDEVLRSHGYSVMEN